MAKQPEKVPFRERLKQIRAAFVFTAKRDRLFIPLVILAVLIPVALTVVLYLYAGGWMWIPVGVLSVLLAALIVLNWRANNVLMAEAEGQPGAAAAILQQLRGGWRVMPAVQATTQQDFVHRVLGRPGIILIAEGSPNRVRSLLGQEKKRLSRVAGDAPIYDFVVGNGENQVPIRKLRRTVLKLPRNITGKQVVALHTRLTALGSRPQMPKGPIPKNMRPPKGAYKALRGR